MMLPSKASEPLRLKHYYLDADDALDEGNASS